MKCLAWLTTFSLTALLAAAPVQSDSFQKNSRGWDTRKYWGGEVSRENNLMVIKTTNFKNSGKFWGRALGTPLNKNIALANKHFKVTVTVKGQGQMETGFLVSICKPNNKWDYRYVRSEKLTDLTGEFQQVSCTIDLTGVTPKDLTPFVEVKGEGNVVYLQSCVVEEVASGGIIAAEPLQFVDFTKGRKRGWDTRKYWGGEVSIENAALCIKSSKFKNDFWGRAMGSQLSKDIPLADKCFKIEITAKGKGDIVSGFLLSTQKDDGKWSYRYVKLEPPVSLTGEYQKISCSIDLAGVKPTFLTPFVDVLGENNVAYIKDVKVWQTASGDIKAADQLKTTPKKAAVKKSAAKPAVKNRLELIQSESFKKGPRSWATRQYWGGDFSHSGSDIILKATNFKNKFWGRAMGVPYRRMEFPGKRFVITVTAKGQGDFYPGFLISSKNANGKWNYNYSSSAKPHVLTDKYQKYTFSVDLTEQAPFSVTPYFDVRGENSFVSVNNIRHELDITPGAKMTGAPFHVVVAGSKAPAREFKFSQADATVQTFQFPAGAPEKAIIQPEISSDKGIVTIPVQGEINGLTQIIAAAEGATVSSYVLGMDKAGYDRLDAIAKQVKTDKPLSILYIADSLADFDRGFNAIDHLGFFLGKYNPGKFSVHNYAVAGDYILRVEERLNGKRPYDKRYEGIFDRAYDLIIIALGNNDTRATSSANYENPLVPAAEIQPAFERVINILRKHTQAPIWLVSASKSDSELLVKKSNAATDKGRLGIRFGIAKHAENYNNAMKALVASGKAVRYIDVYDPMIKEFSSANYRSGDGVHLSLPGHRLFAEVLLKEFTK